MGDDVTEWSNPVHVERRCPLCRATRTRFVDVYSDGDEVVECSFSRQQCKGCGLSCKHWDAIDALTAENAELREKVADYVDTVSAMVIAATGTEDIDEQERLLNAAGPKPSCFIAELRKRVEVAEHQRDRALAAFTELKMVSLPPHDVSGTSMWDKATAAVADVRREIGRTALTQRKEGAMTCPKCHCKLKYWSDYDQETGELECAWWECSNCGECYEAAAPQYAEPKEPRDAK